MFNHSRPLVSDRRQTVENQSRFNFVEELQSAFRHAPSLHLTEGGEHSAEQLANLQEQCRSISLHPDTSLGFWGNGKRALNEVSTENSAAYPFLLKQALSVVGKATSLQNEQLAEYEQQAKHMAAHELEHATAIHKVSPLIGIEYGVHIVRYAGVTDRPFVGPFVAPRGWLRKIDLALIAAAPTKLSEGDIAIIHYLGYTTPEEVLERHANLPLRKSSAMNLLNVINKGREELNKSLW